jgi:hypothetical protein
MADPIKRLNFFKHQFLRASDFIDEQKYHMEMRRRHNRTLHTWGIAGSGLKVTFAQGATAVSVSPGMAVDNQGREIVLTEDRTVELSGFAAGAALYITIAYGEKQTNPTNETGAEGNTRWTEDPQLLASLAKPGDVGTNIVLARVTRNALIVNGVDESERRAAGVEAGDLTVRTLTLSRSTVDAAAWPRLSCSAANQSALENCSLKIDANREVFFMDGGQLRSFDNSHRIVFNRANNRLELYEYGDIAFLTGGAAPAERMRVGANGNVGIGVGGTADSQLHIAGGQWDLTGTEGDLKIGNAAMRLKIGVALGGAGAGDVRLRAQGGTNRLMLGSGTTDTLTLTGASVGIGTVSPDRPLTVLGASGTYINVKGNNGDVEVLMGADGSGGIVSTMTNHDLQLRAGTNSTKVTVKANGNVGIGTTDPGNARVVIEGTTSWDNGLLITGDTPSGVGLSLFNRQQGHKFSIFSSGVGDSIGPNGFGIYDATTGTYRFGVNAAGLVGISTYNPQDALDVNGGLRVLSNSNPIRFTSDWSGFPDAATNRSEISNDTGTYKTLMIVGNKSNGGARRVSVWDRLEVNGTLLVTGGKSGYIMDRFINNVEETLELGDVVVIGGNQTSLYYGLGDKIPVPEADLTDKAYDTRVCGIVCEVHGHLESEGDAQEAGEQAASGKKAAASRKKKSSEPQQVRELTSKELDEQGGTNVKPGQVGYMVTLGAFANCKVDADIAPINVGDILTTSPTRGHAQKVLDPSKALGAVIGKALGSLKKGKGTIPVIVTLQ